MIIALDTAAMAMNRNNAFNANLSFSLSIQIIPVTRQAVRNNAQIIRSHEYQFLKSKRGVYDGVEKAHSLRNLFCAKRLQSDCGAISPASTNYRRLW